MRLSHEACSVFGERMSGPLIVLVAGETSGDNLGGALIAELRARRPALRFAGIAGPKMRAAGCVAWGSAERLAVMGIFEVLRHLRDVLRLRRELLARMRSDRPALYIGIDAAEFNLSVADKLGRLLVPAVQYVSPQVWAWRQGRARRMAKRLRLVLCVLPFEKQFYDSVGLRAEFVGHPLADRLPEAPDRARARAELGITPDACVVALLPGSRRGEVERLGPIFLAAALWLKARRPDVQFVAPMANPEVQQIFASQCFEHAAALGVRIVEGGATAVLVASNAVLVASGTATLETLLCQRPMVVAYRLNPATFWLMRRLIKVRFFSQPNLLADHPLVPEFLQDAATPEALGQAVLAWLDDPVRVGVFESECRAIHASLRRGATDRAADAVLAILDQPGQPLRSA